MAPIDAVTVDEEELLAIRTEKDEAALTRSDGSPEISGKLSVDRWSSEIDPSVDPELNLALDGPVVATDARPIEPPVAVGAGEQTASTASKVVLDDGKVRLTQMSSSRLADDAYIAPRPAATLIRAPLSAPYTSRDCSAARDLLGRNSESRGGTAAASRGLLQANLWHIGHCSCTAASVRADAAEVGLPTPTPGSAGAK